ncbi:hypothetical protein C5Y97_23150 [Blastopirellula marina]|uniref:Uncharacterized protein n=1 Tax=Blastopirellula marina TaxID=124 RepID=A0A2S8F963_9BACT|nr:hypothetical protein C5Y98_23140 [Blastopirellula marina]PTL41955.1 hypothetical protein C5Y97_23150 [Blastopirellula marina]
MTELILATLETHMVRIATAIDVCYGDRAVGSFSLSDRTCRHFGETQPSGGVVGQVANGIG